MGKYFCYNVADFNFVIVSEDFMKKITLSVMLAMLVLTACDKHEHASAPAEQSAVQTTQEQGDHAGDDHEHGDHHDHEHAHDGDHAGHDHSHEGHEHAHEGDSYKCGDLTAHIAVHDHEGEIEAHVTLDDITYDFNVDDQDEHKFSNADGMTLMLDGGKAVINTTDKELECVK